ncbi:hypothetical protein [Glaciihabitans sp. UYNi722]|uniref:hypothetical protein n=1 Tax=Glaciihabitans sp. UYNi722 TaxID=3156344 RepID=UPI003393581E
MIVALVDERGVMPKVVHAASRTTGPLLAARVDSARRECAPSMREDDNGGVINALVVAAHDLTPIVHSDLAGITPHIADPPALLPATEPRA